MTAVHPGSRYGEMKVDAGLSAVTEFNEKPTMADGWVSGGFFAFERSFIDDYLDEDPELLLVTSDVDLHVTLIGEATSLASLGPLQPIGRKKGQTARAMKAVATHAAQQPATAKANRGFQAASRCASRSETDR